MENVLEYSRFPQVFISFANSTITIHVSFALHTSFWLNGRRFKYDLYAFKLAPGQYKGDMFPLHRQNFNAVKCMTFWRRSDKWKAASINNQQLAEILGKQIEQHHMYGKLKYWQLPDDELPI
jgi:hypothetical protein